MVFCVVGARPNFPKVAPLIRALIDRGIEVKLIHTGQHYGAMSDPFFTDLDIPHPDFHLGVVPGTPTKQMAEIMLTLEPLLVEHQPQMIFVVGDVNSTLAAALVAARLSIPIAHVEAGLRSGDRTMPEELNRIVVDHLADMLFTTTRGDACNLLLEGIPQRKIHFVGNVMIDTLLACRSRERCPSGVLLPSQYALMTVHRPANVDRLKDAQAFLQVLHTVLAKLPVVLPLHPRTLCSLSNHGIVLRGIPGLTVTRPLPYLEFLYVMARAEVVVTDSGGVQEETTVLGIPCITVRTTTERGITLQYTNTLTAMNPPAVARALSDPHKGRGVPEYWDGHAATRIADIIMKRLP